jgi:hypothetical protein
MSRRAHAHPERAVAPSAQQTTPSETPAWPCSARASGEPAGSIPTGWTKPTGPVGVQHGGQHMGKLNAARCCIPYPQPRPNASPQGQRSSNQHAPILTGRRPWPVNALFTCMHACCVGAEGISPLPAALQAEPSPGSFTGAASGLSRRRVRYVNFSSLCARSQ